MPVPSPASATPRAATTAPTFTTTCSGLGGVSTFPKQPQEPIGRSRARAISTNAVNTRDDAAPATASTAEPVTDALTASAASTAPTARTTPGATGTPKARSAPTAFAGSATLAAPAAGSSNAATRNGPAQTPIRRRTLSAGRRGDLHRHQHAVDEWHEP